MENLIGPFFIVNLIVSLFLYLLNKDNEKRIESLKDNFEHQAKRLSVLREDFDQLKQGIENPFKYSVMSGDDKYIITKRVKKKMNANDIFCDAYSFINYYELFCLSTGEYIDLPEHQVYTLIPDCNKKNN